MSKLSFSSTVAGWVEKIPEAAEAVRNESLKEVVRDMQRLDSEGGRMRHNTGFLQASLMASTAAMPRINPAARPSGDASYDYNPGTVEAVIIGAGLNDTIYVGYTAAYAVYREFGARGQAPDAFVRTAVQGWDSIVSRNAKKAGQAFGLL